MPAATFAIAKRLGALNLRLGQLDDDAPAR